jgi:hypothetical protein
MLDENLAVEHELVKVTPCSVVMLFSATIARCCRCSTLGSARRARARAQDSGGLAHPAEGQQGSRGGIISSGTVNLPMPLLPTPCATRYSHGTLSSRLRIGRMERELHIAD